MSNYSPTELRETIIPQVLAVDLGYYGKNYGTHWRHLGQTPEEV